MAENYFSAGLPPGLTPTAPEGREKSESAQPPGANTQISGERRSRRRPRIRRRSELTIERHGVRILTQAEAPIPDDSHPSHTTLNNLARVSQAASFGTFPALR